MHGSIYNSIIFLSLFLFVVVYCCTYVVSGDDAFSCLVYSGGGDAVIKAWHMGTGDNVLTLKGHTQEVVHSTTI
jgi:WD40 repeat protein